MLTWHPFIPQERIRELLNRSGGVAAELFAAARTGAEVPGGSRNLAEINGARVLWVLLILACLDTCCATILVV